MYIVTRNKSQRAATKEKPKYLSPSAHCMMGTCIQASAGQEEAPRTAL